MSLVGVINTKTPIVRPNSYTRWFRMEVGAFFAVYNCLAMILSRYMVPIACTGDFAPTTTTKTDGQSNYLTRPLHMCLKCPCWWYQMVIKALINIISLAMHHTEVFCMDVTSPSSSPMSMMPAILDYMYMKKEMVNIYNIIHYGTSPHFQLFLAGIFGRDLVWWFVLREFLNTGGLSGLAILHRRSMPRCLPRSGCFPFA